VSIGLGLCDERNQAVVLDAGDEETEERRIASTREAFERALMECAGCVMAMEVGTHSRWVTRSFRSHGFHVIVANSRQAGLIRARQRKTDHLDARMLARLGRAYRNLP
jgi:hypothetical protein